MHAYIFCLDCSTLQVQLKAIQGYIVKTKILLENCKENSRAISVIQYFITASLDYWTLNESKVQLKLKTLESECGVLTTISMDQPTSVA